MTDPAPWLILLPLGWASAAFLLGPARGAWLATAGLTLGLLLAVDVAAHTGTGRLHAVGGWPAPLGIELAVDGLAALMLLLTHAVALPLALYARPYFARQPEGQAYFWPLGGYLIAALNALFLSADLFNLYVALELLGLAAVGLVASAGSAQSLTAALRYLFVTLLGSSAYLLGVALLYGVYGHVALPLLVPQMVTPIPLAAQLALALMLAGLLLKTALFPFSFWLPPAHGGAPAPVSALLSALVIKATFYLILRLWMSVGNQLMPPSAAHLLGLMGGAAVVWGSVQALRQVRLKMLVAYSTVAQIGYLFLLFPLAARAAPAVALSAWQGVLMQAVAHGLAKAAMFAAAGAVAISVGDDRIERLGGASARLPLPLFAIGLAGVTLMGLPPSAGFLAKWLLLDAAAGSGRWFWAALLLGGGLLAAAYVFKVLRHAFVRVEEADASFEHLSPMLQWPPILLAVASLVLGLNAGFVLALAGEP
jgi:formate hydrogenlyase subunit 3/multisubunit Na+/H+ antiporter MnhD subunit